MFITPLALVYDVSGIEILLTNDVLRYEFQAVHKQLVRFILLLITSGYSGYNSNLDHIVYENGKKHIPNNKDD